MGFSPSRTLTSLALVLALPSLLHAGDLGQSRQLLPAKENPALEGQGLDRPDLRRAWDLWWFGGRLSPEYLDYKNQVAAQEIRRWGISSALAMPSRPLPAMAGFSMAPAGVGSTWVNLGPTANLTDTTWPDINSGRPSAVAVDPASNTLYLATSGGGVWKCTNADPKSASTWTWTPITDGLPNSGSAGNVAIGALAMSPASAQTLYLGLGDAFDAEGRGFYVSTDGGSTWTASSGLGAATRSFDILAASASVVLWGTNDGLKRSSDGGATFNTVTTGPVAGKEAWSVKAFSATELTCSVLDPKTGLGSLYYSSDAGQSWTQVTFPSLGTNTYPGRITLAVVPNGTQGYAEVEALTIDPNTGQVTKQVIGRGVLVTSDKGHTWTWKAAPTATGGLFQGTGPSMTGDGGQSWYNQAIAVDPTNPSRLIMGANLAMYRSMDGGGTWQQLTHWLGSGHVYSHADFHTVTYKGGMFFVGNDGGLSIFKDPWRATIPTSTPDLTFMDNTRNRGLATHLVYNVGSTTATNVSDGKYRISLGMQDNGTRLRQPAATGGALTGTESVFEDEIGGDGFATVFSPSDGNQVLGSLYYTDIYKATDGGGSYTSFKESITGITEANDSSLTPFQPRLTLGDSAHPATVYTATNGKVYQSTDFGSNWAALPTTGLPPGGTSSSSDPTNALYIRNIGAAYGDPSALAIAANQGRFFLSYNGGSTWTQSGTPPLNAAYTSYVWFDRTNSSVVYAASVAASATAHHLWKSIDQGASWSAIDGNGLPFGIPVHVVQTDPAHANWVYAGTDFGVYRSTDGGSTWARFGSGLPMVATRDLYLAPDGSFVRAATFGRGVWEAPLSFITPSTAFLALGGTVSFTASSSDPNSTGVTWSATAGALAPATTPGDGTTPVQYTAPATLGAVSQAVTVTATGSDGKVAGTATVTVYDPTQITLAISPSTPQMIQLPGVTPVTFTATTNLGSVNWSVSSGGSLSAASTPGDGKTSTTLTFPTGAADYTVTATSALNPTLSQSVAVHVRSLDVNNDGVVDVRDLLNLMFAYGQPSTPATDLDGSGAAVGDNDLTAFLTHF